MELENQQLATTVDELRLAVKNQRDEMDSMQMKLGLKFFLKPRYNRTLFSNLPQLDGQEAVLYELEQAKARIDGKITPEKPIRHSREVSKVTTSDFDLGSVIRL